MKEDGSFEFRRGDIICYISSTYGGIYYSTKEVVTVDDEGVPYVKGNSKTDIYPVKENLKAKWVGRVERVRFLGIPLWKRWIFH